MNNLQYHAIVLVISLALTQMVSAAPPDKAAKVLEAVQTRLEETRNGEYGENRLAIDAVIFSADSRVALDILQPFEQDADPNVRREAVDIAAEIGRRSQSQEVRQEVVDHLMVSYEGDSDFSVASRAYGQLFSFRSDDFSEQTKAIIRKYLHPKEPNREMTLIAGVANMQDQIPLFKRVRMTGADYKRFSPSEKKHFTKKLGWKARLALARMGNQEDIVYCIEMVQSYSDVDTRVTSLLHELAYIRQPEAIRVIQQYLESDGHIDSQGDVLPRGYWEYAMNILANTLEDFPIERKNWRYSLEDRDIVLAWMKTQTELKIKR